MDYLKCSAQELEQEYASLKKRYEDEKGKGLSLNMARGKPGKAQLDLSLGMLDVINSSSEFVGADAWIAAIMVFSRALTNAVSFLPRFSA